MNTPENIFGKQRGRFDKGAAQACDALAPERCLAGFVGMSDDSRQRFVTLFNQTFDRPESRKFRVLDLTPNGDAP